MNTSPTVRPQAPQTPRSKPLLSAMLLLGLATTALAAEDIDDRDDTLQWTTQALPAGDGRSDVVDVVLSANIKPGWIVYASDFEAGDFGPRPARLVVDAGPDHQLDGGIRSPGSQARTDRNFAGEYRYTYFSGQAEFRQRIQHAPGARSVSGVINGQTCFEESGLCTLFRQPFTVALR